MPLAHSTRSPRWCFRLGITTRNRCRTIAVIDINTMTIATTMSAISSPLSLECDEDGGDKVAFRVWPNTFAMSISARSAARRVKVAFPVDDHRWIVVNIRLISALSKYLTCCVVRRGRCGVREKTVVALPLRKVL